MDNGQGVKVGERKTVWNRHNGKPPTAPHSFLLLWPPHSRILWDQIQAPRLTRLLRSLTQFTIHCICRTVQISPYQRCFVPQLATKCSNASTVLGSCQTTPPREGFFNTHQVKWWRATRHFMRTQTQGI